MTANDLPPSVLGVEPEMTYRVRTSHPTEPTDGSPFGTGSTGRSARPGSASVSTPGAPRYRWLTTSLFVAAGRLLGTGHIEYAVHRIT